MVKVVKEVKLPGSTSYKISREAMGELNGLQAEYQLRTRERISKSDLVDKISDFIKANRREFIDFMADAPAAKRR